MFAEHEDHQNAIGELYHALGWPLEVYMSRGARSLLKTVATPRSEILAVKLEVKISVNDQCYNRNLPWPHAEIVHP